MVYFTEKLIHEIRSRSCIWDTADVNHLNKEMLRNTWTEIAQNLYPDWHTLGAFDKRDRVIEVKKKWTNIKDSFVKDLKGKKARKSRVSPENRRKYYLFDHLQFLIPFIQNSKRRKTSKNNAIAKLHKRMRKCPAEGSVAETVAVKPEIVGDKSGIPEVSVDVQRHVEMLSDFAGKPATDTLCQLDGDLSFLVSLLPTIKSMNERRKINFKIGVLQLISRIKFEEDLQESTSYHSLDADYHRYFPDDDPQSVVFGDDRRHSNRNNYYRRNHNRMFAQQQLQQQAATLLIQPVKQEMTVDSSSSIFGDTEPDNDEEDDEDGGDGEINNDRGSEIDIH